MATVTGLTAERMNEIIDDTIVNGSVVDSNLILTKYDGSQIDLGSVGGISKESSFPTIPAPEDGDMIIRTDLPSDPLYKFTDGAWEQQPRMGAQTVPACRVSRVATQSIPNSTNTAIAFDSETYDTNSIHDLVSNTTRMTIQTPGVYDVDAFVEFAANAAGNRDIYLRVNGTTTLAYSNKANLGAAVTVDNTISATYKFVAGDYVEVFAVQSSGAALNVLTAALSVTWLGGAGQTVDERGVPAVRASRGGATQSIPTGAWTSVAFDAESLDTDSMHDTATNNSRFYAKTPGVYNISANIELAGAAGGAERIAAILKNSGGAFSAAAVVAQQSLPPLGASGGARLSATGNIYLAAGDYIEVLVFQDTGAALNAIAGERTSLSATLTASGKTVTPFAKAFNSSTFTVTSASTDYAVPLNAEEADNDGIHDTATNNTRFVCRTAGVYSVEAAVDWPTNNAGSRQLAIKKNGSSWVVVSNVAPVTGATTGQHVAAILELVPGDYLEMIVRSDGVAGLVLPANSQPHVYKQHMSMVKVGAPASGPGILGPAQADVFTVATLPAANTFPNGRIVGVSDGAGGQQARMAMNGAWLNLG